MKVLVACEFSGVVRNAFRKLGHNAWSCDILDSEDNSQFHIKDDILNHLNEEWDLMIGHPPCTYLSNAGIGWFNEEKYGEKARQRAILRLDAHDFVMKLYNSPIPRICVENPTGWLNSHWRKPDQIIQPYQFGDEESKRTCLWFKNLPPLIHTKVVKPKIYAYYKNGKKKGQPIYGTSYMKFAADRWKERSRTFQGIADAMATQWGSLPSNFTTKTHFDQNLLGKFPLHASVNVMESK